MEYRAREILRQGKEPKKFWILQRNKYYANINLNELKLWKKRLQNGSKNGKKTTDQDQKQHQDKYVIGYVDYRWRFQDNSKNRRKAEYSKQIEANKYNPIEHLNVGENVIK